MKPKRKAKRNPVADVLPEAIRPGAASARRILTEEQLQAHCKLWQERLRLQDWQITVAIRRGYEIKDGSTAHVEIAPTLKEAAIAIMHPEDYENNKSFFPQDMEVDMVHELIHIHFPDLGTFSEGSREHFQIEQGVESIATSFIRAYRRIEELEALCPKT